MIATLDQEQLNRTVLARFAADLHTADPDQLEHLARRAEMPGYVGEQMRDLVEDERARRVFTTALLPVPADFEAGSLGVDFWIVRTERWERAGRIGDPSDPEYDDVFYQGRDGGEGGS